MGHVLWEFLSREQATTAVEYAVMLALIIMTAIVAISAFGGSSGVLWGNTSTQIANFTNGGS